MKEEETEDLWGDILPSAVVKSFAEKQIIQQHNPNPNTASEILNRLQNLIPTLEFLEQKLKK